MRWRRKSWGNSVRYSFSGGVEAVSSKLAAAGGFRVEASCLPGDRFGYAERAKATRGNPSLNAFPKRPTRHPIRPSQRPDHTRGTVAGRAVDLVIPPRRGFDCEMPLPAPPAGIKPDAPVGGET